MTTLGFNNWISYNLSTTTTKDEKKVLNKGSNKKSNIAKIDDDNEHQNPIKLLPIVGKPCHRFYDTCSAFDILSTVIPHYIYIYIYIYIYMNQMVKLVRPTT